VRRAGLTAELLDRKLLALVNFDPRNMLGEDGRVKMPNEWDDETAAAIAGIENEELFEGSGKDREHIGTLRKVKIADRIKPIELGYKRLGLLKDQSAFNVGALTIVIQD
jgi:phage terminase small subunit